jgi:hypothetical protein
MKIAWKNRRRPTNNIGGPVSSKNRVSGPRDTIITSGGFLNRLLLFFIESGKP